MPLKHQDTKFLIILLLRDFVSYWQRKVRMDLLISMKAETILKGLELSSNIMMMPTAQSQGYFIAEFRESDSEKIKLLKRYVEMLEGKLDKNIFQTELTSYGFKLKKKVDEDIEYMEAWERWVVFSRTLYNELLDVVGG